MAKDAETTRLARIVARYAKRFGVMAAVYVGGSSFSVATERGVAIESQRGGFHWVHRPVRDCYLSPGRTARSIRAEIRKVWA
jgi:hypothetical protein